MIFKKRINDTYVNISSEYHKTSARLGMQLSAGNAWKDIGSIFEIITKFYVLPVLDIKSKNG